MASAVRIHRRRNRRPGIYHRLRRNLNDGNENLYERLDGGRRDIVHLVSDVRW